MIKPFFISSLLLLSLLLLMFWHYSTYDSQKIDKHLVNISHLTHITSLSLSVKYYEPRLLFVEEAKNPAYLNMPTMNKMDFIYAE